MLKSGRIPPRIVLFLSAHFNHTIGKKSIFRYGLEEIKAIICYFLRAYPDFCVNGKIIKVLCGIKIRLHRKMDTLFFTGKNDFFSLCECQTRLPRKLKPKAPTATVPISDGDVAHSKLYPLCLLPMTEPSDSKKAPFCSFFPLSNSL